MISIVEQGYVVIIVINVHTIFVIIDVVDIDVIGVVVAYVLMFLPDFEVATLQVIII